MLNGIQIPCHNNFIKWSKWPSIKNEQDEVGTSIFLRAFSNVQIGILCDRPFNTSLCFIVPLELDRLDCSFSFWSSSSRSLSHSAFHLLWFCSHFLATLFHLRILYAFYLDICLKTWAKTSRPSIFKRICVRPTEPFLNENQSVLSVAYFINREGGGNGYFFGFERCLGKQQESSMRGWLHKFLY